MLVPGTNRVWQLYVSVVYRFYPKMLLVITNLKSLSKYLETKPYHNSNLLYQSLYDFQRANLIKLLCTKGTMKDIDSLHIR